MEDFGEYTPPDAGPRDGTTGTAMHNRYPTRYHCAAYQPRSRARAAPARPLPALGLDRRGALRADRLGRRPDHGLGLRRPALGGQAGPDIGLSGVEPLGLGHRRLLLAGHRRAAHPGAADALDRVRRRSRRDADRGDRDRASRLQPRPQICDPGDAAGLAALREAAHPALPLPRRPPTRATGAPGLPIMRAPRARLPGRPARGRRRTTSSCFGPDLLAAPVIEPGQRHRGVSTCRAGAGSTSGASRYDQAARRLRAAPRAPAGAAAASGRVAGARWTSCRCCVRAGALLPLLPPRRRRFRATAPPRRWVWTTSGTGSIWSPFPAGSPGPRSERTEGFAPRSAGTPAGDDQARAEAPASSWAASLGTLRHKLAPCEVRVTLARRLRRSSLVGEAGCGCTSASTRPGGHRPRRCLRSDCLLAALAVRPERVVPQLG